MASTTPIEEESFEFGPMILVDDESSVHEPTWEADVGDLPLPAANARVTFCAPGKIRREGQEDEQEGLVVNLSRTGAMLTTRLAMSTGERLWLSFRLDLASRPVTLLCETIWFARLDGGNKVGVRFAGLTREEAAEIEAAVSERTEGRAAAWSLPVLEAEPTAPGIEPTRERPTRFVHGLGTGVLLAGGLLGALVSNDWVDVAAPNSFLSAPRTAAKVSPVATIAAKPAQADHVLKNADAPAVGTDGAQAAAVDMNPDGFELALETEGPGEDHIAFWLENPLRFVVDVVGTSRSRLDKRNYQVDHPLVRRVRVGEHPDKVRFVVEVSDDVEKNVQLESRGSRVSLFFRKRAG